MSEKITVCPNCGQSIEEGKRVCPNCGAEVARVWPPPPAHQNTMPPLIDPFLARREAVTGFVIGCGSGLGLYILFMVYAFMMSYSQPAGTGRLRQAIAYEVPLVVVGTAYVIMRRSRPHFARGLGYSLLIVAVLLAGAFAICH